MQVKITKTQLLQIIKEETQGEAEFAPLEAARQAYLQEPNDDTKHEFGLMINKLVEPIMAEMGLFWEAEAYYNRGDLVFNNRNVDITIDPKGAMGRYDVEVLAQVSAMDTDPAFEPMEITIPSMKGVVQFINDKVFKSSGMAGEPEAQTELPFGKGGLAKENKMKITKSQLQQVIREAIEEEMSSFDMAEDVIELLGSKYNVMEEDVPTILMAMANSLEDKPESPASPDMEDYESDYRDPPRKPLTVSGRQVSKAQRKREADMMKNYDI